MPPATAVAPSSARSGELRSRPRSTRAAAAAADQQERASHFCDPLTRVRSVFLPVACVPVASAQASDTSTITGSALLTLLVPDRPGVVHLTARLQGLQPNAEHSFHFHTWGDMTVDMNGGQLGSIYSENGIVVEELTVNEQGIGLIDQEFESETLLQHVGRALTLHEGPDKSTPTVAAAVCGLAHPRAILDTTGAVQITMSGTVFGRGTLYYMICAAVLGGGCIVLGYLHNKGKINLPIGSKTHKPLPPPPPPDGKATSKTKEVEVEVNKV